MRGGFALAAKAVIIRDDKALILRRSEKEIKSSYINKNEPWDLPGGSVRYSENSMEGLLREIKEETSLKVRIVKPMRVFDAIKPKVHMTIVTYLCEYHSSKEAENMKLPSWMLKDINLAFAELELRKKAKNKPRI